jgi:hypothetical protein
MTERCRSCWRHVAGCRSSDAMGLVCLSPVLPASFYCGLLSQIGLSLVVTEYVTMFCFLSKLSKKTKTHILIPIVPGGQRVRTGLMSSQQGPAQRVLLQHLVNYFEGGSIDKWVIQLALFVTFMCLFLCIFISPLLLSPPLQRFRKSVDGSWSSLSMEGWWGW